MLVAWRSGSKPPMRSLFLALSLFAPSDALRLPAFKTSASPLLKAKAAAAIVPTFTALPALAVETARVAEASDLDSLNGVLTGAIGLFLLVIGYFGVQAVTIAADQTEERIDRLGLNKKRSAPGRRVETLYDDTDFTYRANRQAVTNSRDRKKQSKQFGKDGKRLAPWMVIDEKRVDKVREQRKENKRKTGKFFG